MSNNKTLMNIQYLDTLKSQREEKYKNVYSLEEQVAKLRKNPENKITSDLQIYQLNKQIEILKNEISDIDKEKYALEKSLKSIDKTTLDAETLTALNNIFGEVDEPKENAQENVEPVCETDTNLTATLKTTTNETKLTTKTFFKTLYKPAYMIILAIFSVLTMVAFYQVDHYNLISRFCKFSNLSRYYLIIFSALILGFIAEYSFKNITNKKIGDFFDYTFIYILVITLFMLVLCAIQFTKFKLLFTFAGILYCVIYYISRIKFYNVNVKEYFKNRNTFVCYYYSLFSKCKLFIIFFFAIVLALVIYLLFFLRVYSYNYAEHKYYFNYVGMLTTLFHTKTFRIWIIVDLVILGLLFIYFIAFTIIRIKEQQLKIIDLFALFVQIVFVEFYAIIVFLNLPTAKVYYVIITALFIISVTITTIRITNYKKCTD